jgi:hypothetical protein
MLPSDPRVPCAAGSVLVKPEEADHLCNSVEGGNMYPTWPSLAMPQGYNQGVPQGHSQAKGSVGVRRQSAFGILLARYKSDQCTAAILEIP